MAELFGWNLENPTSLAQKVKFFRSLNRHLCRTAFQLPEEYKIPNYTENIIFQGRKSEMQQKNYMRWNESNFYMTKLLIGRNQTKIKIRMNYYAVKCELPLFKIKL